MERNYFNDIMDDIHEILQNENTEWPYELNTEDKIKLLNAAIEYFTKVEEYEKCDVLQRQIVAVTSIKKPKRSRKKK